MSTHHIKNTDFSVELDGETVTAFCHQPGIIICMAQPATKARRTRNILDQKEPIVASSLSDVLVNDATKREHNTPSATVKTVIWTIDRLIRLAKKIDGRKVEPMYRTKPPMGKASFTPPK